MPARAELTLDRAATSMREALRVAQAGLVERDVVVELVALAAVAREHLLVIGPPGTAKSEAVRRTAKALGGSLFEYLLGRFTEPGEIFGPVDLKRLRDGVVETATAGMLPEADVAFLDEVFLGSTAILNTLLALLNERTFRRGHTSLRVPLRVCVGASNALPDDTTLAAFADRFLLRVFVEPVPDPLLEDLLAGGRVLDTAMARPAFAAGAGLEALDVLTAACLNADTAAVRPALADAVRALRSAGVLLSDRRIVKLQRLVAAAAVLAGRATPTTADLWPVVYAVPTREAQDTAREALADVLQKSDSTALAHAALEASEGPRARARLLAEAGDALLKEPSPDVAWRRRAQGILREIDAAFDADALPHDLESVRTRLADAASAGDA
jgi:MoxR-like ATPase